MKSSMFQLSYMPSADSNPKFSACTYGTQQILKICICISIPIPVKDKVKYLKYTYLEHLEKVDK